MTMKVAALFLCLVAMVKCQGSTFLPCDSSQGGSSGPPLPELPDQFTVQIEANIIQKNYTMYMTEYYDYVNNRGAVQMFTHLKPYRLIFDLTTNESFVIFENKTCHIFSPKNSTGVSIFLADATGSHIKRVKDMMVFGAKFGETYISGDEQVRGIPVDHWKSCIKFSDLNGTFNIDYYFSRQSYKMPLGLSQVPIRATVVGQAQPHHRNGSVSKTLHEFNHTYDFINFQPGAIKDESVFQIPVGVFCNGSGPVVPIPQLPPFFTAGIETTNVMEGQATHSFSQQLYFDYYSKLLRVDNSVAENREDAEIYGNDPITFIHDFNSSLLYAISQFEMNCTVTMETAMSNPGQPPSLVGHKMKVARDMFGIAKGDYVYQGRKTWRGMDVEAWAMYNTTSKQFVDVLFRQDKPPDPSLGGRAYTLVGIYMRGAQPPAGRPAMTSYKHVFGYTPGHTMADVFDISKCYDLGHNYSFMMLTTEGSYERQVRHYKKEFYASLRFFIARAANVSVTRVAELQVDDESFVYGNHIGAYFKLLESIDSLKVKGSDGRDFGPSLKVAINNLKAAITSESGVHFDVQYPNFMHTFLITKDSLWEISSSQTQSQSQETSSIKRYGPGSMAGLAIGMLVVGVILGLLGAYLIYRKIDPSVPYSITD